MIYFISINHLSSFTHFTWTFHLKLHIFGNCISCGCSSSHFSNQAWENWSVGVSWRENDFFNSEAWDFRLSKRLTSANLQVRSHANSRLLWFCFTLLCDWLTKLVPLSQPVRSKAKTNRELHWRIFPRLAPVARNYFKFWLVHWWQDDLF